MLLFTTGFVPNEILNASYNYTPQEIELLLMIINTHKGENELTMNISTLTANYGSSHNNIKELRGAITNLLSKPLEYYNQDKQCYVISAVITSAFVNVERGTVKFTFNPDLSTILQRGKEKYSRYNFQTMLKLRGRYAKRLYLFCNAWRKTGVWTVDVERLRKMLKVEEKYKQFTDFEKRVLTPAFIEINDISEYQITPELMRSGKKITSLLCTVITKKEFISNKPENWTRLKQFGLSDWQIENVINTAQDGQIEEALNMVIMNRHQIKNTGGYLVNIFKAQGVPMDKKLF